MTGPDQYDYMLSSVSLDAQNIAEVHVCGRIEEANFTGQNTVWIEFGLITQYEKDLAFSYPCIPCMFNNAVFMLHFLGSGGAVAYAGDYAGDFAGGIGSEHSANPPFWFDLKLKPNIGGTGGMAYLSINGGPFDGGLPYGVCNWNLYGGNHPPEDLTNAYLIVQMYSGSGHVGTSTVSFYNVGVDNCQSVPADHSTWGQIKSLYRE